MTAAQVAVAALVAVLIGASATMFVVDDEWPGWIFAGFGLLGFMTLLGMIATNRRA